MFYAPGAGCGDDRKGDRFFHHASQFQILAEIGVVLIDAVKEDLAGPQLFHRHCHCPGVHRPSFLATFHDALASIIRGKLLEKLIAYKGFREF